MYTSKGWKHCAQTKHFVWYSSPLELIILELFSKTSLQNLQRLGIAFGRNVSSCSMSSSYSVECSYRKQVASWNIISISKEISPQTCLHIHVVRGCRASSAVSSYNRWSWSIPWRQFGGLQSQRGLRIDILPSICILHRVVQCRGCLTDGALCRVIASCNNNKYCLQCLHTLTLRCPPCCGPALRTPPWREGACRTTPLQTGSAGWTSAHHRGCYLWKCECEMLSGPCECNCKPW